MTTYETWEKTMMERIASINRSSLPDPDKQLLKDRAVEPTGLWIQRESGEFCSPEFFGPQEVQE